MSQFTLEVPGSAAADTSRPGDGMRIIRLVSVHLTAITMVVGGIVLAAAGPAVVVALGVATASVGVGYLYAELAAERAIRQIGEVPMLG